MTESIEVLAVPDSISQLMGFADTIEQTLPLSAEQRFLMRLAIEEIATNIIKYSYAPADPGPIQITCGCQGDQLHVTIRDRGRPFDPHDAPAPDLGHDLEARKVGGLGLFLVTEFSDRLFYRHDPASGWNELKIIKGVESHDV
jgi:anti-sigma regulatory factor (Ser/Thr protein kinase)